MTDEVVSTTSAEQPTQDLSGSNSEIKETAPVSAPEEVIKTEPKEVEIEKQKSERTFTRDELARATAAAKHSAYEQAKSDYDRQQQATPQANIPLDQIKQGVMELYAVSQAEQAGYQLLDKVKESAKSNPEYDVDNVLEDLKQVVNIQTAGVFNQFDNAADIIYDLWKNPEKIPQILGVIHNPRWVHSTLKKISDTIKSNKEAAKQTVAKAPLSQEKPSNVGLDSGSMSVTDLRSQSWLRG